MRLNSAELTTRDSTRPSRPRTVLVVEDTPEDREVIERLLRRFPEATYEVRAASVGGEGLEAIRSGLAAGSPPDCVLLDYHLPDMTALEFLERVADELPESAAPSPVAGTPMRLPIPILVLTGTAQRLEPAVQSLKRGALDYLSKSGVTPVTLHRAIEAAVERFEAARQLEEQRVLLARQNSSLDAAATRTARLLGAATALAAAVTPREVATALVDAAVGALAADGGTVAIHHDEYGDNTLTVVPTDAPRPSGRRTEQREPVADGALALAAETGEAVWQQLDHAGPHSVAVPLMVSARPVGALELQFGAARTLDPDERAFLLTVARIGGQALHRARLFADATAAHAEADAARARAEAANQAKAQFLATMSHELRTPLNAIRGYADLMQAGIYGSVTGEQRDALGRILRSEAHLLGLINEILEFARIEAEPPSYRAEPVPLGRVTDEARAFVTPQLRAKAMVFEAHCEEGAVALADVDRVRQIVVNLLSNALKFTPMGGQVALRCERRGDQVAIVVSDTGVGIPRDQLTRIFEPFVQLGRTFNAPATGTGLGLSISRDLARGMKGELTVESVEGMGATFTLTLPAA